MFTIASWNLQSDRLKGPGHDGSDRRGVKQCVAWLLVERPDIVVLLEMQRCKSSARSCASRRCGHGQGGGKSGYSGCRYCDRGDCDHDHAQWVHKKLLAAGYDGEYHQGSMMNTVGLYFRSECFARATADGRMLFVAFDGRFDESIMPSHKGAVLAVLRHRATGEQLLAIAAHLSVPKLPDGTLDTTKQLGELAQLRDKVDDVFRRNQAMPLVMAGDFNSVPHAEPGIADPDVYEELTAAGRGWELESAYKRLLGAEPPFTAFSHTGFVRCIDYIFASPETLEPLQVLGPLPAAPPAPYPSDHLPVSVRLRFAVGR